MSVIVGTILNYGISNLWMSLQQLNKQIYITCSNIGRFPDLDILLRNKSKLGSIDL